MAIDIRNAIEADFAHLVRICMLVHGVFCKRCSENWKNIPRLKGLFEGIYLSLNRYSMFCNGQI